MNLKEDFNVEKPFEPKLYLNQFDFGCKYNKNYNRFQDCSDYHQEVKKEILIQLERQKTQNHILKQENEQLKELLDLAKSDRKSDEI